MEKLKIKKEAFCRFLKTINAVCPVERDIVRYDFFNDDEGFVFKKPCYPAKNYFLPDGETLFEFENNKIYEPAEQELFLQLILMPRCDVNALDRTDSVYLSNPEDKFYRKRRNNLVVMEIPCEPSRECFYERLGLKDYYDVKLDVIDSEHYLLSCRTKKGKNFLKKIDNGLLKDNSVNKFKINVYDKNFVNKNPDCDNEKIWKNEVDK
mgnify:FL=1